MNVRAKNRALGMDKIFTLMAVVPLVFSTTNEAPSRRLSVLLTAAPTSSHIAAPIALGEELVRRGHNVTLFTFHIKDFERPRKSAERAGIEYWAIDVNVTYDDFENALEKITTNPQSFLYKAVTLIPFIQRVLQAAENALDAPALQSYDVIISTETTVFVALCASQKRGLPHVHLSTSRQLFPHDMPPWPFPVSLSQRTDNLTFAGRLQEAVSGHVASALFPLLVEVLGLKLKCPYEVSTLTQFPGVHVPNIVPTVIGFEYPRPIAPLTTYTGPILPPSSANPLPGDVRAWLDDRPSGSVVYISMGSLAYTTHQVARAIVEGLNATGYSAVWSLRKRNRAVLEGLEVNEKKILLLDWAPQLAILRHGSIKMAILHGGMNGLSEALHSGVPIIVMPLFGDQPGNAARVAHFGLGISLDIKNLTGAQIAEAINEIAKGDYHKNTARLRRIFHHAGGVAKAADLVEFYATFGYNHLIPAYARYEWSWIKYYNVDVYAFLLAVGGVVIWVMCTLCCRCCRFCGIFRRKHKQD